MMAPLIDRDPADETPEVPRNFKEGDRVSAHDGYGGTDRGTVTFVTESGEVTVKFDVGLTQRFPEPQNVLRFID